MKTIFLQLIIVEEKTIFNMNRRKEIIMISATINEIEERKIKFSPSK